MNSADLPLLYDSLDPEALDTIIQGQGSCRVTFEYNGYEVAVAGTGHIVIQECKSSPSEDTA